MKWLGRPSPFHLFTNPCVINRFIFGQGVVIYYIISHFDNILIIFTELCKYDNLQMKQTDLPLIFAQIIEHEYT